MRPLEWLADRSRIGAGHDSARPIPFMLRR